MINYLKEYGISDIDFIYLNKNLTTKAKQELILAEDNVREILKYYNSIDIKNNLYKIILYRLDLILLPLNTLQSLLSNIDLELFKSLVDKHIEDLVIIGI